MCSTIQNADMQQYKAVATQKAGELRKGCGAPDLWTPHSNQQQAILRSHKNKAQKLSDDLKNIRATPLHHSYHVQ